jgi:hypothetical protein
MIIDSIKTEFENLTITDNTEEELIRFMTDWGHHSGRRDTAILDAMLPDDLIQTTPDGTLLTKAQYLDGLENFPADFRITDYDQQVQIFDAAAIVRAASKLETNENVTRLRYTATFIKRGGKWNVVALHSSHLAAY